MEIALKAAPNAVTGDRVGEGSLEELTAGLQRHSRC